MWSYILRRLFFFIPTFILITLISFWISINAPGDPVEQMLVSATKEGAQKADIQATEAAYLQKRHELGLDLPLFYFSISPLAIPDTLYKIPKPNEQKALRQLIYEYGNWEAIQAYYIALKTLYYTILSYEDTLSLVKQALLEGANLTASLKETAKPEEIKRKLKRLISILTIPEMPSHILQSAHNVQQAFAHIEQNSQYWKVLIPTIHFYGTQNQYHRWLMGLFRLDFGISYMDKRPITDKLLEGLKWSLIINFISIILIYLISIPIGIDSAIHRNSIRDRITTTILFILYSLPNFWVATMLIFFFGGGDYFAWFPAGGVQSLLHSPDWPLWKRLLDWAHHLILPIVCFTYGGFAFLSRQMRVGMLEVLSQDFIRTARAKGLPEKVVIWKHAFRNSLIPIITLFASIFPAMVGGSVILETIFSIPGMGFLSYNAIIARDYPVIVAVFALSGTLTLIGILVADILYAIVDPRISFTNR